MMMQRCWALIIPVLWSSLNWTSPAWSATPPAPLTRAMREKPTIANRTALASYASLHAKEVEGALASLALATFDIEQNKSAEAVSGLKGTRAHLDKLGDYHGAHLDLAGAYYRAGELGAAETHARRALELGYPNPGVAYNYLACIAHARSDLRAMQDLFLAAARTDPQHHLLMSNVERARRWFRERGPERNLEPALEARHDFQLFERTLQPTLPGPLPPDFADWTEAATTQRRVPSPRAEAGPRRLPLV